MSNNIKEFVNAANAGVIGIMKDLEFKGSKGEYCSFKLVDKESNTEKEYELCFSGNPKADHPKAERAMRASNAVMDLFSKIESSYNCFAVAMASIEPPTPEELRSNINLDGRFKIEPAVSTEESGRAFTGATTHMLEVIIDIFLGNEDTKTVVDTVYVEYTADKKLVFSSASGKQFATMTGEEYENFFKPREDEAKDKAKEILCDLRENVGDIYNKILAALSADKESKFSKFFADLKAKRARSDYNALEALDPHARNIGRIEMRYNALFLGAERFKKFVYKIKDGSDTFDFHLEWGRQRSDDEARSLYYLEDEKTHEFIGLTTEAPKDKSGAVLKSLAFKNNEKIVCGQVPRTEKGVFVLKKSVFPDQKYKRYACDRCGSEYFSNDKDHKSYRAQFSVIDSNATVDCGCERCAVDGRVINEKNLKYIKKIESFDREKCGAIFARVDSLGKYVKDGNVFTCSHCNSDFYIGDINKKLTCDVCGSLVCKSCRLDMMQRNSAFDCLLGSGNNNKLVFCNGCKKAANFNYKSKTCKIYDAFWGGDEKHRVNVIAPVGLSMTKLLEKCADCRNLLYLGNVNAGAIKRCERCGMYLGSSCQDKARSDGRSPLLICKACQSDMAKSPAEETKFYTTVFKGEISKINAERIQKIKSNSFEQLVGNTCFDTFKSYMRKKDRAACASGQYKLYIDGDPFINENINNSVDNITASSYKEKIQRAKSQKQRYNVEFIVNIKIGSTESVYSFIVKAEALVDGNGVNSLDNTKVKFGGFKRS